MYDPFDKTGLLGFCERNKIDLLTADPRMVCEDDLLDPHDGSEKYVQIHLLFDGGKVFSIGYVPYASDLTISDAHKRASDWCKNVHGSWLNYLSVICDQNYDRLASAIKQAQASIVDAYPKKEKLAAIRKEVEREISGPALSTEEKNQKLASTIADDMQKKYGVTVSAKDISALL